VSMEQNARESLAAAGPASSDPGTDPTAVARRAARIVYVEEGGGFGGAVTALANVLPFLRKLGFETHVVLAITDRRAEAAMRSAAEHVYLLPHEHRSHELGRRLKALNQRSRLLKIACLLPILAVETAQRCSWLAELNQLLRRLRPDIVHCNNGPQYNAWAALLARMMGYRTVVFVRGLDLRTRLARFVEAVTDAETFVAEHLREGFASRNRRQLVVYDGLDLRAWAEPERYGPSPGPVRVGHIGMFMPAKGQDMFLEAASRVATSVPNVEFYLVGDVTCQDQDAYREKLYRIAEASGHADRIHFLGFRSDMRDVLRELDVVVQSSLQPEALGTVVLEGMASGRPVVASDEGGPREMIRHGMDGLLFRPRDPGSLAEAIESLVREPGQIARFGRSARRRVEEVFSAETMAERLAELYLELLRDAEQR